MRTREQLEQRLTRYLGPETYYHPEIGLIVWQLGTGENLEILFIEVAEYGKGLGIRLIRKMVERLKVSPYHSVFVYRLESNLPAGRFYRSLGFREHHLGHSIYRDDQTVIAWIPWEDLLQNLALLETEGETESD